MYVMTDEERAERQMFKALHKAVRADFSQGMRYRNLAWGFIRGFKFRRIERNHHMQDLGYGRTHEHNMPYGPWLLKLLQQHVPEVTKEEVSAWLADPTGAIPAPPPRPKRPFMRSMEAAPAAE